MKSPIDFYFDFSSPYGYLAAEQIETLGMRVGREINWHPILLGAIFKVTGGQPLTSHAFKGDYSLMDFKRSAAYYGIPYNPPKTFPIATQNSCRAVLWMHQKNPAHAKTLALELYRAFFRDDRDIGKFDVIADLASTLGYDESEITAASQSDEIKAQLKTEVEAAIAKKVFGSPYFIVDGEPFWGADRLPMMEKWLTEGAWKY